MDCSMQAAAASLTKPNRPSEKQDLDGRRRTSRPTLTHLSEKHQPSQGQLAQSPIRLSHCWTSPTCADPLPVVDYPVRPSRLPDMEPASYTWSDQHDRSVNPPGPDPQNQAINEFRELSRPFKDHLAAEPACLREEDPDRVLPSLPSKPDKPLPELIKDHHPDKQSIGGNELDRKSPVCHQFLRSREH